MSSRNRSSLDIFQGSKRISDAVGVNSGEEFTDLISIAYSVSRDCDIVNTPTNGAHWQSWVEIREQASQTISCSHIYLTEEHTSVLVLDKLKFARIVVYLPFSVLIRPF